MGICSALLSLKCKEVIRILIKPCSVNFDAISGFKSRILISYLYLSGAHVTHHTSAGSAAAVLTVSFGNTEPSICDLLDFSSFSCGKGLCLWGFSFWFCFFLSLIGSCFFLINRCWIYQIASQNPVTNIAMQKDPKYRIFSVGQYWEVREVLE